MTSAFDMHANWRPVDPRKVMERCKRFGGTVTPYARYRGLRSFIVSFHPGNEGAYTGADPDRMEGHLYVVRCQPLRREARP